MIKPLTSLRFFFALYVFFSHTGFFYREGELWFQKCYDLFLHKGFLGVSFFFVLSGFILSHAYLQKFKNNEITFRKFWLLRIFRIVPLHVITLFISIPFYFIFVQGNWDRLVVPFITNLFLLQSFVPNTDFYFAFNGPAWSISNELFFYLLFPFLISILSIKGGRWLLLYLLLFILAYLFTLYLNPGRNYWYYINPFVRLGDFILGILLYQLYTHSSKSNHFVRASVFEIASVIMLMVAIWFHYLIPKTFSYSTYYWIPLSLLIYGLAQNKGALSKLLSHRHLVYLGEISFGFYMIHFAVIRYYWLIRDSVPVKFPVLINLFLLIFVTLALAHISYQYFEKPIGSYLVRKFRISKK